MSVLDTYWQRVGPYVNDPQGPYIALQQAEALGMSAEQVAASLRKHAGPAFANATAGDVGAFLGANPNINYQVGDDGRVVSRGSGSSGSSNQPPGSYDIPPTSTTGGGGGTPNAGPEYWAQIAQSNQDYNTAVQNSIFQNPNITLADGSTQQVSFGRLPDYKAYIQNNPDLLRDFQAPDNPIKDLEAYGRWHWQNNGQYEGRSLPTGTPAELGYLQPEVSVNLSDEEQAIFDADQRSRRVLAGAAENQLNRISEGFEQPNVLDRGELYDPTQFMGTEGLFDFSGDPSSYLPDQNYEFSPTRSEINAFGQFDTQPTIGGMEDVYQGLMEREQDRFDRRREATENDLIIRGLNRNSEAWDRAFDEIDRAENDFSLAATQQAGDIQSRLFNMENQAKNTGLNALQLGIGTELNQNQQRADVGRSLFDMEGSRRQQGLGERELNYGIGRDWRQNQVEEDAYFRNQPLNEYNALMGGTQIPQPQFTGYQSTGFSGPDWAGAERESFNRDFLQQQRGDQRRQGWMQLGGSLLGAAGSAGGFGNIFNMGGG